MGHWTLQFIPDEWALDVKFLAPTGEALRFWVELNKQFQMAKPCCGTAINIVGHATHQGRMSPNCTTDFIPKIPTLRSIVNWDAEGLIDKFASWVERHCEDSLSSFLIAEFFHHACEEILVPFGKFSAYDPEDAADERVHWQKFADEMEVATAKVNSALMELTK